jgi:hypothetical protein
VNLTALCTTIQTALHGATIAGYTDGLTVDLYQPRSANPPQAWITADTYTPETFGDTSGIIPITIVVGVSQADWDQSFALAYELASDDTLGAVLRNAGVQVVALTYTNIGTEFPIGEIELRGFQIQLSVVA